MTYKDGSGFKWEDKAEVRGFIYMIICSMMIIVAITLGVVFGVVLV